MPYGSPSADARGPVGAAPEQSLADASSFTATTMAGQDLEHAPKPMSDLSHGLRGFLPQQRHSRSDLGETEEHIKLNRTPNSRKPRNPQAHHKSLGD